MPKRRIRSPRADLNLANDQASLASLVTRKRNKKRRMKSRKRRRLRKRRRSNTTRRLQRNITSTIRRLRKRKRSMKRRWQRNSTIMRRRSQRRSKSLKNKRRSPMRKPHISHLTLLKPELQLLLPLVSYGSTFINVTADGLTAPPAMAASHERKADETKPELSTTKSTESHEKKGGKRGSIFGSLFGGKKDVTSPTAEKTEAEAAPAVPTKDTAVAPVSETAPKIDEPIQSKPIDTAAVTAPVDTAIAAHDLPANSVHAQTTTAPTTKSPTSPSHKGGVLGFFKRQDSKVEVWHLEE
jgi:hypothetical protein